MTKGLIVFLLVIVFSSCSQKGTHNSGSDNFVLVKEGTFNNTKLSAFSICKYEVTQKEWVETMGSNPSMFKGDSLPVEKVSWYDCIEYCNKRSIKEGLKPYYSIDKDTKDLDTSDKDSVKWMVLINTKANGYRLPTEVEWEYAASGAQMSKGYKYSGSNDINEVAWFFRNAGDKYIDGHWNRALIEGNSIQTNPIGVKKPNELGIYDMSGNVREWCWDTIKTAEAYIDKGRILKGGGWAGLEEACEVSFHGIYYTISTAPDLGLRVCRGHLLEQ